MKHAIFKIKNGRVTINYTGVTIFWSWKLLSGKAMLDEKEIALTAPRLPALNCVSQLDGTVSQLQKLVPSNCEQEFAVES